uniref:hypothetical protein n=1 Tax=Sphingopyxis terrae TaxID=33052 RepID=UPI0036D41669
MAAMNSRCSTTSGQVSGPACMATGRLGASGADWTGTLTPWEAETAATTSSMLGRLGTVVSSGQTFCREIRSSVTMSESNPSSSTSSVGPLSCSAGT